MNDIVLKDIWSAVTPVDARESFLKGIGQSLISQVKPFPDNWVYYNAVLAEDTHNFMLDLTVHDEDCLTKFHLKASFDFAKRKIFLEAMALYGIRGQGLGRALLQDFLGHAGRAGFTSLTLQSSHIGSYFWVVQGVQPDMRYGLVPRIQARLDEISRWVSSKITDPAYSLLLDMCERPETVRDLAALDFREEIAMAFASPEYQASAKRYAVEGLHPVKRVIAEEVRLVADLIKPKQSPTLGQLLLVDSGWSGSMSIQPL